MLVPLEDPDGAATAHFDRMTDAFCRANDPATPPEVFAYARYLADYVYAGHTIDLAVTLHNVEAAESAHVACPFIDPMHEAPTLAINQQFAAALIAQGYRPDRLDHPWQKGLMAFRLYGWCAHQYAALDLAYEVNDRYPAQPLSLMQLQQLGGVLGGTLAAWCASPDGGQWHQTVEKCLVVKRLERAAYFAHAGHGPEARTPYELLIRGY